MSETKPIETLQDIRQMMERSSRFISLSGLSGVAAGCCALIGAWFAMRFMDSEGSRGISYDTYTLSSGNTSTLSAVLSSPLFAIAVLTFIAAFVSAFVFTWLRSKKNNTPIWGYTAQRLMINVSVPMLVGGIFLWKMLEEGLYGLVAPGCLIFYGLALVNAGKYTLKEVRYLGYLQILLGLINLWCVGYGIYFWALGFGVLHIIYGTVMWWRYEKA